MDEEVIELLERVFSLLPDGVDLSKGGVGEIALAHHLGHTLVSGDKGADGIDESGTQYEYKISTTNQFNFHFGARTSKYGASVSKHFDDIAGAFCAIREGMTIVEVAYVPSELLVPALIEHFSSTSGRQLNKNFNSWK